MKRILSLLLAALLLALCLSAHAEPTTTDLIPLVEAENDAYMFERREDGSLRVLAKKQDLTGDAYANSRMILRRSVADFTLEFDYVPTAVEWQQDRISFRCDPADENEWNEYEILIRGNSLGEGQRGVTIVKGEGRDNPYAYVDMFFDEGTQYFAKLIVKDHHVTLYFDEDPSFPFGALIEIDLPDEKGADVPYHEIYLPKGDFQIVSWGGDFVMNYFRVIEGGE